LVPTALNELPLTFEPPRKRWTRAEYASLAETTVGQERLELVDGELISKMGKKRPHVNALIRLQWWLLRVFGPDFVHPEAPIDVAPQDNLSSEPEPDLIVTSRDLSHFLVLNPQPADVVLLVEIANTTLGFDLTTKARLYARAGIADYWVVDVPWRRIIVHRDPVDGEYRMVVSYAEGELVSPLAAAGTELRVREIFPG
jgi:Uma2 family endonuclease